MSANPYTSMAAIEVVEGCTPEHIPAQLLQSTQPLVLKGLVNNWPLVQAGRKSPQQGFAYLCQFYNGQPVNTAIGNADNDGKIFYNGDFSGFNYQRQRTPLDQVYNQVQTLAQQGSARAFYVDSAPVDFCAPGLRQHNDLALGEFNPRVSLWLGNKTRVQAHHDLPDNIACVVLGRRRFTLFPPEQLPNLYIGPLDFNPAGPAISLVDIYQPDFARYPRYREALAAARFAELEAGDAIFIPSLWWHQVEGLEPFNVMMNYWWTAYPAYCGSPLDAFNHALMNIKSLPADERQAWKQLFDFYVFDAQPDNFAHIPPQRLGLLGDLDETAVRRMRAQLLNRLNR